MASGGNIEASEFSDIQPPRRASIFSLLTCLPSSDPVLIFYGYGRSHSRAFETFSVQQKSSEEWPYAHSSIHGATIKTCSRQFYETIEEVIEILPCVLFIVDNAPYRHEFASEAG
jgi:hypothetical protein